MPSLKEPIRVLLITLNKLMLELIKTALENEDSYSLVESENLNGEIIEDIAKTQPNCILLDYLNSEVNSLSLIDSISFQFPEIIVVAILPQDMIAEANRAILAGARAFMLQPFSQKDLISTLGRIKELHERNLHTKHPGAENAPMADRRTFTIFSPKGGSGCSTISINLSIALKEELDEDVLLIDGKLFFGDIDILLNLKTQNSIADLIPHINSLDEGLIRDVIAEHISGIKVLPSPINPVTAQGIHPEEIHRILAGAQNIYPNIIIDGGNFLNENTVTLMDASHRIILVVTPDIVSLRDASRFLDICRTALSIPKEKILVTINQHGLREGISTEDIERALQVKVFAVLPSDPLVTLQSINRGVPVYTQFPKSPLRKAFQTMTANLAGIMGHLESASKDKKTLPEVLSKSSRLG